MKEVNREYKRIFPFFRVLFRLPIEGVKGQHFNPEKGFYGLDFIC